MSKEDFHDRPDYKDDLSAFEQQLRSIDPTPPQTAWQDVSPMLEQSHRVSANSARVAPPSSTARWLRIVTHSAAILIGIGIGALWMMLQPPIATAPQVGIEQSQQTIEQEPVDAAPKSSAVQHLANQEFDQRRHRMSAPFGYRNVGSGPLTPLAREIESRPSHRMPHDVRPVVLEDPAATFEPTVSDKPMSAPELMREMLNKLAHLPSPHDKEVGNVLSL